jgi:Tfp pilus assembly protein PilO
MEAMSIESCKAWLSYQGRKLGWQGVAGIVLIIVSLVGAFGLLLPETVRLDRQHAELQTLREQLPQRKGRWVERSPQSSLETFYGFLPEEGKANAQVGILLYAAEVNGLVFEKVSYKLSRAKQGRICRYQISLPIRGTYMQIRTFVNQALNEMPALALNDIGFTRQEADTEQVEANLTFTLFLRNSGSHG